MFDFFNRFSLSQRSLMGFAVILLLLAGMAALTVWNISQIDQQAAEVVDQAQPAAFAAQEVQLQLERATGALGMYLQSERDEDLQRFDAAVAALSQARADLNAYSQVELQQLEREIDQYIALAERIMAVSADERENMPGMAHANDNANPLQREISGLLAQLMNAEQNEPDLSGQRRELLFDMAALRANWGNVVAGLRGYMSFRSEALRDNFELYANRALEQAEALYARYQNQLTFEQIDAVEQLLEKLPAFLEQAETAFDIQGSERWRMDAYMVRTELAPELLALDEMITEVVAHEQNRIAERRAELGHAVVSTRNWQIGAVLLGVLIVTVLAMLSVLSISRPLTNIASRMRDIAEGDGDLTRRIPVSGRDEIAQVGRAFNTFADTAQNLVAEVVRSAGTLKEAAGSLQAVAEDGKRGAAEQEKTIEQLVDGMAQTLAAAEEVAESAEAASHSVQEASGTLHQGLSQVTGSAEYAQELDQVLSGAEDMVNQLSEQSQSIGKILDVIGAIAEQTNLLALNAAIEAARAGEHGRGFAVVAEEVRSLANRTQDSTREITEIITKLRDRATDAVNAMGQGRDVSQKSLDAVRLANTQLNEIASRFESLTDMSGRIAAAAEEQTQVSAEMKQNIEHMSTTASATAEAAGETARSGEGLARNADDLNQLVRRFKV